MEYSKSFSIITVLIFMAFSYFIGMQQNLYNASKLDRCPFCCGMMFCKALKEGEIKLDNSYFLHNIINTIFPNKSVLFAKWKNKKVVLKLLQTSYHFNRLESLINQLKLNSNILDVGTIKNSIQNIFLNGDSFQNIKLCPSIDNIDLLITPALTDQSDVSLLHKYINIWTLFQINVEPIIQQVLKGGPIATYLGSCGHIVITEHCGEMLTIYAKKADWNTRVSLSLQLIEAALQFTFEHPTFRFYFTDISADNIAVSEDGILKLIDVDNVIIVDKNPTEIPHNWDTAHRSEIYETDVFTFSPEEICSHNLSDHNLYAVCQEILGNTSPLIPGGLLNSPPQALESKLNTLLDQCIRGVDRFKAVTQLLHILQSENIVYNKKA